MLARTRLIASTRYLAHCLAQTDSLLDLGAAINIHLKRLIRSRFWVYRPARMSARKTVAYAQAYHGLY